MTTYLGLDLGTSVLKATVIDDGGQIIAGSAKEISIHSPKTGYAEESVSGWWKTFCELLNEINSQTPLKNIKGVGLSGQMHGLVCYDKTGKVLRPAIIWADKRSTNEVESIGKTIGFPKMYGITGNPIFTGFMLPSLLWLKKNEKKTYGRLAKVSSPKDFIAFKLTGALKSEPTDALATGCFDYKKNCWSGEIIKKAGLKESLFPEIMKTSKPYGKISRTNAKETGLPGGIPVFGGSDQSMAAMGCGLVKKGDSLLAISTGGQFLVVTGKGIVDPKRRLHTLNHALEGISISMGATLSAGLSLKWFKSSIMQQLDTSYDTFIKGIDRVPVGSEDLIYLPFLAGERTPYFNPHLKGGFIGQSLTHTNLHFIRAIMEGVAFSFRDCLESFKDLKIPVKKIILSGGGSKNATWRQILTDVLNVPTEMINVDDHSPFGAAVYAKFAQEGFSKLPTFYKKVLKTRHKLNPDKENVKKYEQIFRQYKKHARYLNEAFSG
ncbi:MAG TPA: xylulokinase [Candidatus Gracilibacteria bacterium]|nr:xylulokinase [Candidatus Gracilibacteria bacterium]